MGVVGHIAIALLVQISVQSVLSVKIKMVLRSDEDSKIEEDEMRTEEPHKKPTEITNMPFIVKKHKHEKKAEYVEEKPTTDKPTKQMHPNDLFFPLIYHQSHINSMFKFGENWYTWSTDKRTDGSKQISYYICYDEPKRCDEVGWEHTDTLPKCAFQIDSLVADDRACLNSFGVEPHNNGACDGAEQMKVSDIVRSCGPRIRSLWRFVRVGRRPAYVAKPADVNSLVCEDEEECFITIEYRIHHDRITFSLHEPSRGQTFKSALKRDLQVDEEKTATGTEPRTHSNHIRVKKPKEEMPREERPKKIHVRSRSNKIVEGKGVMKERNDSGYGNNRRSIKNKLKVKEDVSEDLSE